MLFINLDDNTFLDSWAGDGVAGFPPVGVVEEGLVAPGQRRANAGRMSRLGLDRE